MKVKGNKAQLTIFMIIAVLMLLAAGFGFYFISTYDVQLEGYNIKLQKSSIERSSFVSVVQNCIKETGTSAVYLLSDRGGYIFDFEPVFYGQFHQIAYSLNYGDIFAPSLDFMEKEISNFIEMTLPLCVNYFQDFPGYQFEFGNVFAETSINKNNVRNQRQG